MAVVTINRFPGGMSKRGAAGGAGVSVARLYAGHRSPGVPGRLSPTRAQFDRPLRTARKSELYAVGSAGPKHQSSVDRPLSGRTSTSLFSNLTNSDANLAVGTPFAKLATNACRIPANSGILCQYERLVGFYAGRNSYAAGGGPVAQGRREDSLHDGSKEPVPAFKVRGQ